MGVALAVMDPCHLDTDLSFLRPVKLDDQATRPFDFSGTVRVRRLIVTASQAGSLSHKASVDVSLGRSGEFICT